MRRFWISICIAACAACSMERPRPVVPAAPSAPEIVRQRTLTEEIDDMRSCGDFGGVAALYERRQSEFNEPVLLAYAIESLFLTGRYEAAVVAGDEYSQRFSDAADDRLSLILGAAYARLGYAEAAKRNLVKAYESGVRGELLIGTLIELYLQRGQFSLALNVASDLDSPVREYYQSLIFVREGNYARALERIESSGEFRNAVLVKAYCFYALSRFDELVSLAAGPARERFPELDVMRAGVELRKGRVAEAAALLAGAGTGARPVPEALRNLGLVHELYQGDFEKAREKYKSYLGLTDDADVAGWFEAIK